MLRSAFAITPVLVRGKEAGGGILSSPAPTGGTPSMERITRVHCGDGRCEKGQTSQQKWQTDGRYVSPEDAGGVLP